MMTVIRSVDSVQLAVEDPEHPVAFLVSPPCYIAFAGIPYWRSVTERRVTRTSPDLKIRAAGVLCNTFCIMSNL